MTPEERADLILGDLQAEMESLRNRLASAFREAIEEEREACARVAETIGDTRSSAERDRAASLGWDRVEGDIAIAIRRRGYP